MSAEKIKLDRTIPFVKAVFGLITGEVPVDAAIDVLCATEEKYGIMILGDPYSFFVNDIYIPRPEKVSYSLAETLRLLGDNRSFEVGEEFRETFCMDGTVEDALNERRLYPFLSELCFVLSGAEFEDYCVVSYDPVLVGYSWRWWGGTMADWANTSKVLPPRPQSHFGMWDYIHFYADYYIGSYIEDYGEWSKAVRRVLDERIARLRRDLM